MPTYECPTCHKAVTVAGAEELPARPFCSHRCKMIDLGKWLDGTYTTSEPASPEDYDEAGRDPENPAG